MMKNHIPQIIVMLMLVNSLFSCERADPIQKETPKITLNKKAEEIIQGGISSE